MSEKEKKRFQSNIATLIGDCNRVRHAAERDLADFSRFGIDQSYLDSYEAEINVMEVFPLDTVLRADIIVQTQRKTELRDELLTLLKSFVMWAKLAFEPESNAGQSFLLGAVTRLNDRELLVESRRIKRESEVYLAELSVYGLTQAVIDELDAKNSAFEDAIEEQAKAIQNRKEKSVARMQKANAMYDKMRDLCEIGKTLYYETDEARYNDYLLYTGAKYKRNKKTDEGNA